MHTGAVPSEPKPGTQLTADHAAVEHRGLAAQLHITNDGRGGRHKRVAPQAGHLAQQRRQAAVAVHCGGQAGGQAAAM